MVEKNARENNPPFRAVGGGCGDRMEEPHTSGSNNFLVKLVVVLQMFMILLHNSHNTSVYTEYYTVEVYLQTF